MHITIILQRNTIFTLFLRKHVMLMVNSTRAPLRGPVESLPHEIQSTWRRGACLQILMLGRDKMLKLLVVLMASVVSSSNQPEKTFRPVTVPGFDDLALCAVEPPSEILSVVDLQDSAATIRIGDVERCSHSTRCHVRPDMYGRTELYRLHLEIRCATMWGVFQTTDQLYRTVFLHSVHGK